MQWSNMENFKYYAILVDLTLVTVCELLIIWQVLPYDLDRNLGV